MGSSLQVSFLTRGPERMEHVILLKPFGKFRKLFMIISAEPARLRKSVLCRKSRQRLLLRKVEGTMSIVPFFTKEYTRPQT